VEESSHGDAFNELSKQEAQVFLLIARGTSVKETAHLMSVHEKTVRTYRVRLLEKLNLKTDAEIVRYAIQNSIIS
jgi:DNA-binding NarL/FixJ family response regulator